MSDNHTHTEAPENCTHDCSTCGEACAHEHEAESMQQPLRLCNLACRKKCIY